MTNMFLPAVSDRSGGFFMFNYVSARAIITSVQHDALWENVVTDEGRGI